MSILTAIINSNNNDDFFSASGQVRNTQGASAHAWTCPPGIGRAAFHALRQPRLPLHGTAATATRPLSPVDPQNRGQDQDGPALRQAGRSLPGVVAQPQAPQAITPPDGAAIPQRNRPNSWRLIAVRRRRFPPDCFRVLAPGPKLSGKNHELRLFFGHGFFDPHFSPFW